MVSVVSSSPTGGNLIFLRHLDANFVLKSQKCQICVIYERWRWSSWYFLHSALSIRMIINHTDDHTVSNHLNICYSKCQLQISWWTLFIMIRIREYIFNVFMFTEMHMSWNFLCNQDTGTLPWRLNTHVKATIPVSLSWGIQGDARDVPPPRSPIFFIFMLFSGKK